MIMKQITRNYLLKLMGLTGIVYLLGFIVFNFFFAAYFNIPFLFLPVLFFGITLGFHTALINASGFEYRKFTTRFMTVFGIKLMLLLVIITSYVFAFPAQAVSFLVTFLLLYVIFTLFETLFIIKLFKSRQMKR